MAKPGLQNITTAQTFQTWLDRTNDIIDVLQGEAITASISGDETGSVGTPLISTLVGTFTANTINAVDGFVTNEISTSTGVNTLTVNSQIFAESPLQTAAVFRSTGGARTSYASPSNNWQVGFENATTNAFIIDNGVGSTRLRLTSTGNLTLAGNVTATRFNGPLTGNVTGDVDGNVTGDLTGNVTGDVDGNAATVTNGVYTTGNQTIGGTKTFSSTISGSITGDAGGNAATVTNGVYTVGNQSIGGTKTFTSTIVGSINGNAATVTNGVYTNSTSIFTANKTFNNNVRLKFGTNEVAEFWHNGTNLYLDFQNDGNFILRDGTTNRFVLASATGNMSTTGNITAAGNITATGTVTAGNVTAASFSGDGLGRPSMLVVDRPGTSDAVLLPSATWSTVPLTGADFNYIGGDTGTVAGAGDIRFIRLTAGTYYVEYTIPLTCNKSDSIGSSTSRLRNVSQNVDVITGQTLRIGDWQTLNLHGAGEFTISGTVDFLLQAYVSETAGYFRLNGSFGVETFTYVKIWKIY